jgi:hypothetical protein
VILMKYTQVEWAALTKLPEIYRITPLQKS